MNKPICRITIQDLLDQIDEQEAVERKEVFPLSPERMINSMISLEDTADFFDIDRDALQADLKRPNHLGEVGPISYFRDLDICL